MDTDSGFELRALCDLGPNTEVTIDYGPLSNEELFLDFGFTVDNNPHDTMKLHCDGPVIDSARVVMGLSRAFGDKMSPIGDIDASRLRPIGLDGDKLEERRLFAWQVEWLQAINMYGPDTSCSMEVRGRSVADIDPRLWAYLRILYATSEEDLTAHGYDPFSLQSPASMVSLEIEAAVLKTLGGLLGVLLRSLGTDIAADLYCLQNNYFDAETERKAILTSNSNIIQDIHASMRRALELPDIPSPTLSVRHVQESVSAAYLQFKKGGISSGNNMSFNSSSAALSKVSSPRASIYEGINKPFTSMGGTERSLEDIIRSQMTGPADEADGRSEDVGVIEEDATDMEGDV